MSFYDWLDEQDKKKKRSAQSTTKTNGNQKKEKESFYEWCDRNGYTLPSGSSKENSLLDDDIAPVKERKWFDTSVFDDGLQWSDIPKAVIGTKTDVSKNLWAGILGIGEKLVDAGATLGTALNQSSMMQAAQSEMIYNTISGNKTDASTVLSRYQQAQDEVEKGTAEFVAKDLYDEAEIARVIISEPVKKITGIDSERDSLLGDKSDALVQSGGQLLAQVGLNTIAPGSGMALMAATAFGSEAENAFMNGATYDEALLSATISAGAEVLTEKLGGISFGGKTLTDAAFQGLSRKMTSKLAKVLITSGKVAADMTAEGAEELLSGYISAIGQKMTYMEDKEIEELFSNEDKLESFIGGVVLGGFGSVAEVAQANHKGVNPVSGLTKNEEAVVNKVYEDELAKREKNGKLSARDKTKLYDSIVKKMERGYIDTDTIESVLGGDSYKVYKDTIDSENSLVEQEKALTDEYNAINKKMWRDMTGEEMDRREELKTLLPELRAKIAENEKSGNSNQLKSKLSQEVAKAVQNDRLAESYKEQVRATQGFKADFDKYKGTKHEDAAKKTLENAIKAGASNTNAFHDIVDMAANLSSETGLVYDFKSAEDITKDFIDRQTKEIAKFEALENRTAEQDEFLLKMKDQLAKVKSGDLIVDGDITGNGIVLNYESAKPLNRIIGHEITHSLEQTEAYTQLRDSLIAYAKSKGVDTDAKLAELKLKYEGIKDANPEGELVADLVGDYLFTDSEYVKRLSAENQTLAEWCLDKLKHLYKLATAGSKEARELERAMHSFEQALREAEQNRAQAQESQDAEQTAEQEAEEFSDVNTNYSIREKAPPKNTIVGYKVFIVKDGKLYPPMVANPEGEGTPVGVWLDADVGGLSYDKSGNVQLNDRGRFKVKAGGKGTQGGGGELAFRPGWHLGEYPDASQFGRDNAEHLVTNKKGELVPARELFPYDFVWAKCEVAADNDYQLDAMSFGVNENGNFERSQAGLPYIPEDGYYKYRTNADPNTAPWIISGSIKVVEILDDEQVAKICAEHGVTPQQRQAYSSETKENYPSTKVIKEELTKAGVEFKKSAKAAELKALYSQTFLNGETPTKAVYSPEARPGGKIDLSMFGLTSGQVTPTSDDVLNQIRQTETTAASRKAETADLLKTLPGYAKRQINFDDANIIKEFGMNNQSVEEYRAKAEETGHGYLVDEKIYSGDIAPTQYALSNGLDNEQGLTYNGKRGESYARTDEFRKLQAESQRMSYEDTQSYWSGSRKIDDGLRGRLSRSVKQILLDSRNNGGGNDSRLLSVSAKGNQFNIYKNVNAELFHDVFEISRKHLQFGELVDLHGVETTEDHGIGYKYCDNYLSEDGLSGFSITPDGDLISVFNASGKKGFLRAIAPYVKENAKTLDCYISPKQNLQSMYESIFGFKTASVMDHNEFFDHDDIAKNHNEPKVAFMVNTDSDVEVREFTKDQYDPAVDYRNSFVNQAANNEAAISMPETDIAPTKYSLSDSLTPTQAQLTNIFATNIVSEARKNNISLDQYYTATADINAYSPTKADAVKIADSLEPIVNQLDSDNFRGYLDKIRSYSADNAEQGTKYSLSDSNGNELSPAVQNRFAKSKVVDYDGNLKVVYHGTASGEFTIFDKAKGNVEGDFGSGFYFTDNEDDVSRNYEGGGADFENKIDRRAEQIEDEEGISYGEARKRAIKELYVGSNKFEVYLNIENPAVVGETILLDYESFAEEYDREDYDSDEDYESDVEYAIADKIDEIIWEVEKNVDVYSTDGLSDVLWNAVNEGGIDIAQLKANINDLYLEDSNGNMVGNEVTRQIIESLGYDGIIDPTVSSKFNMGLSEDTTHYIVFKPNQIKNVSNQNPTDNPDINLSLSSRGEDIAPVGNYDFYGKDFRKKEADTAPVAETVAPVDKDTFVPVNNLEDEAPLAEPAKRQSVESVVGDRDSFVSKQAMELYEEITNLKKGVRASKRLGYLLDHGYEWRSIKTALLNIRDNPNQVVNPNSAAESVAREMIGREYDAMVEDFSNADGVTGSIFTKMQSLRTELDNNQRLREQASADFDSEVARLQAEYEAKKNKNTKVANDILRRIERIQRLKSTVDADYGKRIDKLEARLEKMSKPEYKTAMQRKAKQNEYTKLMERLVGDTSTWIDKKLGISYKINTLRRNLRDIVRNANGDPDIAKADAIYDELQGKYNHNEAELKRESMRIKEVFQKMKLNHAEDTYAHMLGEFRHNPDTTLTEEAVKEYYEKHKNKIDTAKVDKAIEESRKVFDELIVRVNERLREQGMKEIPYRQGYFPHFTNPKQGWLAKLFNWKPVDNEIPTSIAGLTEEFNPQRSWQSFNKQRKGDTTDYSLEQGLDTYIHGALDWIYHIEDIQKRRALENHIRYIHSEEGIKARIDAIRNNESYDADEMQDQIDLVYAEANNPLNNFVTDLRAGTNTLANKKSSMDRALEEKTNRKIYSVMTNLNNRINANMVVGSFSSALTNFIPITQSWMEVSPVYSLKGMRDTIASTIRDDGMVNKSDFLTNRLMNEEKLYQTGWDKASEKAAFMMEAIDSFASQTVWRSKYLQNISEGMSETEAIKNADQFAENVIAGRSRGNQPTIFDAKNPLTKIFTAFQLEVANQYGYMFKDAPQDSKNKARLVKGYATAFLGAYAYNALYSSLVGRDAAFDPISILEDLFRDLFGDDEEEPEEILLNLTDNILEEVPFVGGLLGGGRVPLSSALPYSGDFKTFISDISNGELSAKEMLKPVYYLAMPVGGGQLKKLNEGLAMFDDDLPVSGSYTESGNLRFPVEDTIGNKIQAGLFGQYASKNARDYFDNNRSPLKEKQIQEYLDVDIPIRDYWEYREGLAKQKKTEDKLDYISGLDLPVSKKNILANNVTDRKDPIDMEGYEDFSSLDEFDFATKNPGKYAVSQVVGDYSTYTTYKDHINDLEADKDENGKSINGSKKEKVFTYIDSLPLDYGQKCILFKSQYKADDSMNRDILEYLDSREDISYDEMVTILTELGFTVQGNNVYWD